MKQSLCTITEHTEVMPGNMVLRAIDPDIASAARPGQFVNVLCGPCMDPLLRRPFSIYMVDKSKGEFALFYQLKGRGTALLSQKRVGEKVDVVGPIGRPFEVDTSPDVEHILVGGGCGVVPLLFLSDTLKEEAKGEIRVLIGAQNAESVMCDWEFFDRDLPAELSTDDGSLGKKGYVTDLLLERLANLKPGIEPRIYACGPHQMLKAIARIADDPNREPATANRQPIPCQVSLESAMACGFGVCMGCVTKTKSSECPECEQVYCTDCGGDDWEYKRVCTDGPVFYTTELVWE